MSLLFLSFFLVGGLFQVPCLWGVHHLLTPLVHEGILQKVFYAKEPCCSLLVISP